MAKKIRKSYSSKFACIGLSMAFAVLLTPLSLWTAHNEVMRANRIYVGSELHQVILNHSIT